MIYDFHNKLTYVFSFFIASRPFPGLVPEKKCKNFEWEVLKQLK